MSIDAGSIFMIVISPSLIAVSIICSCKRQLKILQSIDNERVHSTEAMNKSISKNNKPSAMTSINSTISNSSKLSSRTIDNQGNKKREIIITTRNIPIVQTDEKIEKLSDMQTQEKIQKLSDMQWKEKIQQIPIKQSSENVYPELLFQQTTSPIDSNCKCSEKKAIIENELLTSPLGRSTSSNASFVNQHDLLLKDNDSQETRSSNNSNVLQHEEQMKQSIISINDNDDVSERNALMIDDIIIFPSEIKWKLKNTVQRVQLQNPTENRFAIKVKCTNNDLYRVKPVFTFVEPKSYAIFHIYRHDGFATVDQILFLTTLAEKTDDDPHILFADSTINN